MSDGRILLLLQTLDPTGKRWSGSPSPAGSLRGVSLETAIRRFPGLKHCIWELALHIAYWEYAVRRMLENGPKGGFPRKPADWPVVLPENASEEVWKADRKLVKQEREALISVIHSFDSNLLDERVPSSTKCTYSEVLIGVVQHSAYHTGQISLVKRLVK